MPLLIFKAVFLTKSTFGELQQLCKRGVVELVAVIIRMQPDSRHAVSAGASRQFLTPVWSGRIDRTQGNKDSSARGFADGGEPGVRRAEILVKK